MTLASFQRNRADNSPVNLRSFCSSIAIALKSVIFV